MLSVVTTPPVGSTLEKKYTTTLHASSSCYRNVQHHLYRFADSYGPPGWGCLCCKGIKGFTSTSLASLHLLSDDGHSIDLHMRVYEIYMMINGVVTCIPVT